VNPLVTARELSSKVEAGRASLLPSLRALGFIAIAALLIFQNQRYVPLPFYADDLWFASHVPNLTLSRLGHFFSPYQHWFYRPVFLVYVSLMFGLFGRVPVPMHIVMLVLHGANMLLLGLLLRRVVGGKAGEVSGWLSALLFMWYTQGNEAVWWMCCTSTLMCATFVLGALHLWISYRDTGKVTAATAAILCLLLALGSKEDAVAVPLAFLLADRWLFQRRSSDAWGLYTLIGLFMLGYLWLDLTAYHGAQWPGNNHLLRVTPIERLHQAGSFTEMMTGRMVPGTSIVGEGTIFFLLTWIAALVLVMWRQPVAQRWIAALIMMLALPLPIAAGAHALGPRFLYLPGMFLCAIVAMGLLHLARRTDLAGRISLTALVAAIFPDVTFTSDPMVLWAISYLSLGLLFIAWRAAVVSVEILAICAIAAIMSQVGMFFRFDFVALALSVLVAALICRRAGWWRGIVLLGALWEIPTLGPIVCLIIGAGQALRARMRAKGDTSGKSHSSRDLSGP